MVSVWHSTDPALDQISNLDILLHPHPAIHTLSSPLTPEESVVSCLATADVTHVDKLCSETPF